MDVEPSLHYGRLVSRLVYVPRSARDSAAAPIPVLYTAEPTSKSFARAKPADIHRSKAGVTNQASGYLKCFIII